ncbi:MAG: 6-bladed beta-propeller [Clostridiaceae bacterium]|jgi:hypothetical protein|nr:6-bladed beta-propeller [Clostridiaceae bacterium]
MLKKMRTFLFFSIIVGISIISVSCNNRSHKENEYETISITPSNKQLPMSQFIGQIEYIKLTTPKEMALGNIEKVIVHDDLFFVRHGSSNPSVSVFNSEGEFQYNIGKQGRGPGEYVALNDFNIDRTQKTVIIMDLMLQKMHFYNLDGAYVRSDALPIHALKFSSLKNGDYIFWVGNLYNEVMNKNETTLWNLYVVNPDLSIKEKHLEVTKEFMSVMNGSLPSSLSPCEDGVNIYAPLSNYIYHYNDRGEFSTKYYLDFGSLNCNFLSELHQYKGIKSSFAFNLRKTGATYYPNQLFEFKKYLYFTFISNDDMYSVYYDKENKSSHVTLGYPVDDINGAIFGRAVASTRNSLITVIEPVRLMDDNNNVPEKLQHLNLTPNSNPVLAKYTMR